MEFLPPTNARLRPVFKRSQQVAETPQSGNKPQGTAQAQSNTTFTVSPPSGTGSMPVQKITVPSQSSVSPHPSSSVKTARSMSIFATKKESDPKTESKPTIVEEKAVSSSAIVIDQLTLLTAWKQMCTSSTLFDHATKMRIESVEPSLLDNDTIEISVANPNVEAFFKSKRYQIIHELAPFVHNKQFNITIRIIETEGPQKILSKYEQMEAMIKLNPAFKRLKEELDLSLH